MEGEGKIKKMGIGRLDEQGWGEASGGEWRGGGNKKGREKDMGREVICRGRKV